MSKKVTIQDIADELGISRNTVSKAINNSDGIAADTRDRILHKAMEMGYKQFAFVSSLSGAVQSDADLAAKTPGYAGEVALFTTRFLNHSHFASLMLDRFQRELSQLGYTLNTHRVTDEHLKDRTLPVTFVKERASAIVCIEMFDRAYDEMVCGLDIPTLFVDGPDRSRGLLLPSDQLYMDNTTGITCFVQEMLRRGKRRIGFIGNWNHCQSFFERYTAFRCAMLLAGETVEERFIIKENAEVTLEDALNSLKDLPDVFICANDFIAIDAINHLAGRSVRVPDDVLFCGFDDSPESRHFHPTLTTIHIHTQVMAFSAVQLLISRIREPSLYYRTAHTETDLIYRESTAPN